MRLTGQQIQTRDVRLRFARAQSLDQRVLACVQVVVQLIVGEPVLVRLASSAIVLSHSLHFVHLRSLQKVVALRARGLTFVTQLQPAIGSFTFTASSASVLTVLLYVLYHTIVYGTKVHLTLRINTSFGLLFRG